MTAAEVEAQLQSNRDRSGYGGLAPLPFGDKFTPKYFSEEYFQLYGAAAKKARLFYRNPWLDCLVGCAGAGICWWFTLARRSVPISCDGENADTAAGG
ncbi:MAG: hypothetical protein NTU53_13570 [Planctomycetota bacterium]|nr:hypothetical protein [Planctomycetota bacterium]